MKFIQAFADIVLRNPILFDIQQALVGAPHYHKCFINDYIRPPENGHVLDIGCGVGASLPYLSKSVRYTGIDVHCGYIDLARSRHGNRGRFICADIKDVRPPDIGQFDVVFALSALHHVDEDVARGMIQLARACLRPGGRFVTVDPCIIDGDHFISRTLIANDRGRYVRTQAEYERLFADSASLKPSIRTDFLNFPYTMIVFEATFTENVPI